MNLLHKINTNIDAYSKIVWAAVTIFCMIGILINRSVAPIFLIITALTWVTSRIISEAMSAYEKLSSQNDGNDRR